MGLVRAQNEKRPRLSHRRHFPSWALAEGRNLRNGRCSRTGHCPSWVRTRTLLIQRGYWNSLNSSNLQSLTRVRVTDGMVGAFPVVFGLTSLARMSKSLSPLDAHQPPLASVGALVALRGTTRATQGRSPRPRVSRSSPPVVHRAQFEYVNNWLCERTPPSIRPHSTRRISRRPDSIAPGSSTERPGVSSNRRVSAARPIGASTPVSIVASYRPDRSPIR